MQIWRWSYLILKVGGINMKKETATPERAAIKNQYKDSQISEYLTVSTGKGGQHVTYL